MHLRGCGVAVGAVLVVTLAACGGSSGSADPSSPLPITTTSASDSPTASASATVDPNSDAAVIAGVRAWVAALNVASSQVTVAPLVALATKTCACIRSLTSATQYLSQHGIHLNVHYSLKSAIVVARKDGAATVKVITRNDKYQALNADGSVFKEEPADTATNQYSMRLQGSRWFVDAIV